MMVLPNKFCFVFSPHLYVSSPPSSWCPPPTFMSVTIPLPEPLVPSHSFLLISLSVPTVTPLIYKH